MYHRNVLESQELRALIQRNERMRIVNQNTPCGGPWLQPSSRRLGAGGTNFQQALSCTSSLAMPGGSHEWARAQALPSGPLY
jgi:hypothetical protein